MTHSRKESWEPASKFTERLVPGFQNEVVVELKAVEKIMPIHEAQLLTYMKLSGIRKGLLVNFNCTLLRDGVRRRVL